MFQHKYQLKHQQAQHKYQLKHQQAQLKYQLKYQQAQLKYQLGTSLRALLIIEDAGNIKETFLQEFFLNLEGSSLQTVVSES